MRDKYPEDINDLWYSFLKGDDKAFALIYFQHITSLLNYGYKISPEKELVHDAVQEVFLDLYEKRNKSQVEIDNLKAYLLVSLKHTLLKMILRQRKQNSFWNDEKTVRLFDIQYCFQEEIISKEIGDEKKRRLQEAILKLSPGEKEIIYLKFEEELEYSEISKILNITIESCRKQLYRAIKALRQLIDTETFFTFFCFLRKKS